MRVMEPQLFRRFYWSVSDVSDVFTVSAANQGQQGTFKVGNNIADGIDEMDNRSEIRIVEAQLTL